MFCRPEDVMEFVPSRKLDKAGAPETSTVAVEAQIREQGSKIKNILAIRGLQLSQDRDSTQYLIVENLNVLAVAGGLIRTISTATSAEIVGYASSLEGLAKDRLKMLSQGELDDGWLSKTSAEPIVEVKKCLVNTPGFVASTTSQPQIDVIERWIARETAIVRVYLAYRYGNKSNFNQDQKDCLIGVISPIVRGMVLAARTFLQRYTLEIDAVVAHLIKGGGAAHKAFRQGDYDEIFLRS